MTEESCPDSTATESAPPGRPWVRVVARLVMVLFTLALPLAVLEAILRAQPAGPPPVEDRSHVVFFPDATRLHPWTRGETNALRIAIVGDSVTVGVGVQPSDAYGARLEQLLNLNSNVRPAEVCVHARAGTGAATQSHLLEAALAENPSVLVMGICLNDAEHSGSPQLKEWRKRLVVGEPSAWWGVLERHSRAAAWLRLRLAHLRINREYYRYYEYLYNPHQAGWQRFVRGIEMFREACARKNVRLVAVIFPLMTDIDRKPYPFSYCHAMIGRAFKERDIPYLDLEETFRGWLPMRMEAFPGVDAHPSEIAHRVIAERLFEFLIAQGCVGDEYSPHLTDGGHQQAFWKALTSGARQAITAPEFHGDAGQADSAAPTNAPPR